ncbi:MAG TPA: glycosyltransferase family 4 protein [Ignavibacteria bacterium]|nr:glycosyltransferase family 4 protein [Ignavibacteria bacterium]HMR39966.1 glycosyltransferase family 4 protein [Ignavibacteria bacterium]
MKINFILPFAGNKPIGGFKIVYEYANRLAQRGHFINLIHPSYTYKESTFNNAKYLIRYYQRKIDKSYNPGSWFKLDPRVNSLWIRKIDNENIPDADIIIATAWRTAACSENLDQSKGKKFYFIQHYETWNGKTDEVNKTWKMPFKKIVIAEWLKNIADSMGENSFYVPNAFEFSEFGMDTKPEDRKDKRVMMLYNELEFKGSIYGLTAFNKLKKLFPDLEVVLFGVPKRPDDLQDWIEYHQTPDRKLLRELYNGSSVFISPSLAEGFPLPPAEAMMCGSALACTDIGGHREYAIDNNTALLFEPKNSDAIIRILEKLLTDRDLRIRLAYAGNEYISQFNWERSVNDFEKILTEN